MKRFILGLLAGMAILVMLGANGCQDDATVASQNLSKAADMFEINRRIVFFNGITGQYLMTIEGRCSLDIGLDTLRVTCKTAPNEYKKHYLGLSDNVSYFAEQVEGADVSVYNYRITFKPSVIIPDVDVDLGFDTRNQEK